MNKGFEIYIQKNLTAEEKKVAVKYCKDFIEKTTSDPQMRYFGIKGGGYTSGLWRGRLGLPINWREDLVFRRISKNSRKFAVVRTDTLIIFNDKYLDGSHYIYRDLYPNGDIPKMCLCPRHRGSLKVRFRKKPELELFFKIGQSKG